MSHNERLQFAEAAGFGSLLFYQGEFYKASEVATDEVSFRATLAKYADIVTSDKTKTVYADIVTLDKTKTVVYNVRNSQLASFLDRTGVVYIGKILYQFGDLNQTVVLDGDRAKLKAPESDLVQHISHSPTMAKGARTSTCSYFLDKEQQVTSDRKSVLSVYIQPVGSMQPNGQWQYVLTQYAIGRPYKKNVWGNWVNYKTDNMIFAHWKCSFYCTEPGQIHGPTNPKDFYVDGVQGANPYSNYWNSIEYWGETFTFNNLNNGSGGSIVTTFEFPTDNGWHYMLGVRNAMSCP